MLSQKRNALGERVRRHHRVRIQQQEEPWRVARLLQRGAQARVIRRAVADVLRQREKVNIGEFLANHLHAAVGGGVVHDIHAGPDVLAGLYRSQAVAQEVPGLVVDDDEPLGPAMVLLGNPAAIRR